MLNGRMRLMFSIEQVEFMRYWIDAMGIAPLNQIPLPDSSFLLRENVELKAVSPTFYQDPEILKNAHKVKQVSRETMI